MTTMDLISVAYFYVAYFLDLPHPLSWPSDFSTPQPSFSVLIPHRIIRPPRRHPSLSHHTGKLFLTFSLTFNSRDRLLLYSLTPTIPAIFLALPLSHCCLNIFNVAFSCFYAASCHHHGSQTPLPPFYPVSFAHTLKIGHVGKKLAGYKCWRPLPVLPMNISLLPCGLPINGVPRGGVPSQ